MRQTTKKSVSVAIPMRGFVGTMILVLLSACGLAMDNQDRLLRAEQAYTDGDYQTVIIDTKNVLLEDPDNMQARRLLGLATVETGDGPAAEKELRRAIELGVPSVELSAALGRALVLQRKWSDVLEDIPISGYPSPEAEASARVSHGDAYMAQNQPESARELYTSALELQPDNLDAQLGIISSHIEEQNYLQANSEIQLVLETNAENPRVWVFSGEFNNRIRQFETAQSNFQVAIDLATQQESNSLRLRAIAGLAISLLEQQETEAARAHIEQLSREAPQLLQTRLLIAQLAYIDQDWTVLQQTAQQILNAVPDYRPAQMLLGTAHLNSGSLTQAEIHFTNAVASQPDDIAARQMLAETRLRLNKAGEAQQTLAPLMRAGQIDMLSLQLAARASLGQGETDEAVRLLRRNVEENPDNPNVRLQLATILIQTGDSAEAQAILDGIDVAGSEDDKYVRDTLGVLNHVRERDANAALAAARQLTQDHADQPGAYDLLGIIQISQGDVDAASANFEKSLSLNPNGVMAQRYLAEIDESKGDLESAESRYKSLLVVEPDAVWAIYGLGRIAFRNEDFDSAVSSFRRASNARPDNPVFRLGLARAEVRTGNSARAIRTLEQDPEATMAHTPSAILLGTLKARAGEIDDALDIARQLQEREPQSPSPYAMEGEIHIIDRDLNSANSAYDNALQRGLARSHVLRSYRIKRQLDVAGVEQPLLDYLEVRPLDSEVRLTLADYYGSVGRTQESIDIYEQVVNAEPTNPFALNNLAWAYHESGDARALDLARRARDAMPLNGSIVDTLGWILTESGSVEEGEAILREAVELSNGKSEIRYHHAVALQKMGNVDEARTVLTEILDSETQFSSREDAERLLAEL